MSDPTQMLLKELTEAPGVSGYEAPVRAIVRRLMEPLGELSQDKIGSVICRKEGSAASPKVMLAGHMDEIGFMVRYITEEGFLKFVPLGGWFDQVLLGQRVIVQTRKGDVVGVIGAKPVHLLSPEERKKVFVKEDMFVDIGATSDKEVAEIGVRPGDVIVPRADFVPLAGDQAYMAKAFDDRVGVAMLISVLEAFQDKPHPNTLYGVATVMEEVGLRGATTSVRAVDPDVAIILESDIAGDVPGIEAEISDVHLGKGPTVLIYDARMIPNLKLRDLVLDTAAESDIPIQFSAITGGATDGGVIHLHQTGVPSVVIGVPARHIHSDSSIMHRSDYDRAVALLAALVERLDQATVAGLTA